jgi:hypothetical protein
MRDPVVITTEKGSSPLPFPFRFGGHMCGTAVSRKVLRTAKGKDAHKPTGFDNGSCMASGRRANRRGRDRHHAYRPRDKPSHKACMGLNNPVHIDGGYSFVDKVRDNQWTHIDDYDPVHKSPGIDVGNEVFFHKNGPYEHLECRLLMKPLDNPHIDFGMSFDSRT